MDTAGIGLLHLPEARTLLSHRMELESLLRDDLLEVHHLGATVDAILLTGDLTREGTEFEFKRLDALLEALIAHLQQTGAARERPAVLAVPGWCDRANVADAFLSDDEWFRDRAVRAAFWRDVGEQRTRVAESFAEFHAWFTGREQPEWASVTHGLLPGDFVATLERDGSRLGIVGLNTTFLEVTDDALEASVTFDREQFESLFPERDVEVWRRSVHAAVLMTHRPSAWFHPTDLRLFREQVAPSGRFAAHLHGFMDESATVFGDDGVAEGNHATLSTSLSRIEPLASHHGYAQSRDFAYAALRFDRDETEGTLRAWPRKMTHEGHLQRFVADSRFDVFEDDAAARAVPLSEGHDAAWERYQRVAAERGESQRTAPHRAIAHGPPTRDSLKLLLRNLFRDPSQFDSFCQEHFRDFYRNTRGLELSRKIATLVERVPPETVVTKLREENPAGFERYRHSLPHA